MSLNTKRCAKSLTYCIALNDQSTLLKVLPPHVTDQETEAKGINNVPRA